MIKSNLSISAYSVPPHPFANPGVFQRVSPLLCLADHLVSIVANPARSGECQAFSGLMSLIFNGRTAEFISPLFRSEGLVVDLDRIAVLARSTQWPERRIDGSSRAFFHRPNSPRPKCA
jgi:hypothetical protein